MTQPQTPSPDRVEARSIEADMAFFEARLSLAGEQPATLYQVAQIKTYKTLGMLLADRLQTIRSAADSTSKSPESAT